MDKKVLILAIIFTACVSNSAFASTPFSIFVRNDGVEIRKCVDDFGKIDYCTVYDRNHALELVKYPEKYSVAEEVVMKNAVNRSEMETFSEGCMNVQYALNTGMTLFNSVINVFSTLQRP